MNCLGQHPSVMGGGLGGCKTVMNVFPADKEKAEGGCCLAMHFVYFLNNFRISQQSGQKAKGT